MIIVWPPPTSKHPDFSDSVTEPDDQTGTLLDRGRKAAQCAIEI